MSGPSCAVRASPATASRRAASEGALPLSPAPGAIAHSESTGPDCGTCWQPIEPGHRCRCECGTLLDGHARLPKAKPLRSWASQRHFERDEHHTRRGTAPQVAGHPSFPPKETTDA